MNASDVLNLISDQKEIWMMGERKWTSSLASKVLARGKHDPHELGFVLCEAGGNLVAAILSEFNLIYLFNQSKQWTVRPDPDKPEEYLVSCTTCACGDDDIEMLDPEMIRGNPKQTNQIITFAQKLGIINNLPHIRIRICKKCREWRFVCC